MVTIHPLLISRETDDYRQQFTCIGIFKHAINLQNKDGGLLTLHRYNKGLSPFGWLLRPDDFDHIQNCIEISDNAVLTADYLYHQDFVINRQVRKVSCTITTAQPQKPPVQFPLELFTQALSCCPQETGLFGPLDQIIRAPISGELAEIQQHYINWLWHETVDWEPYIGKGSGLTPSHDDTLIGMLFTSFYDFRTQTIFSEQLHSDGFFLSEATRKKLPELTTYVSVAYYRSALNGAFSLPLLHLVNALRSNNLHKIRHSTQKITQLGHTSGLDTLLGIWLAANALDRLSD